MATAAVAASPALAQSAGGGATQVVQGTVNAQFGVAIDALGHVSANATTIPATVTHQYENGVEIVTITPRS